MLLLLLLLLLPWQPLLKRCLCGCADSTAAATAPAAAALAAAADKMSAGCADAAATASAAAAAAAEKMPVRLCCYRNAPQAAPRRYSADDAEQMSDDDDGYDEYTWDVAANSNAPRSSSNRSVSKTPGRPPPHRNQRRARHGHAKKH